MLKPKTLYRYDVNYRIEKHHITSRCAPQIEMRYDHGVLFRCRHDSPYGDYYGYPQLKQAKKEAIFNARKQISELTRFIQEHSQSDL